MPFSLSAGERAGVRGRRRSLVERELIFGDRSNPQKENATSAGVDRADSAVRAPMACVARVHNAASIFAVAGLRAPFLTGQSAFSVRADFRKDSIRATTSGCAEATLFVSPGSRARS